jgi:Na+-translocating ferredoxin:NAD+ oxidoreductase RnfD subunit
LTAKQWIKSPKGYVAIALAAYLVIASVGSHNWSGLINGGIAVGVCIVVDVLCCLVEHRKRIFPDGAVVTGLLISLILSTTTSWPIITATAVIAIFSKHVLVHKRKPLFNPAAFGLLLSLVIFHTEQSWWGAFGDLPVWNIAFLLIGGYAVTNRVNKYPLVFAFIGTCFAMLFFMGYYHVGDAFDALRPPFINAAFFLGFFMLTDPPTSPAKVKDQIIFGILAAAVGNVVYGLFGGLMYLFIGLLVGNLYHLLRSNTASTRVKKLASSV